MAAALGMVVVIVFRLLLGKSLRQITFSQYFFGFVLLSYLFLLGIATGILVPYDISLDIIRVRPYNLIPFTRITTEQALLNTLLFLPLGFLLPFVFVSLKKRGWGKIFLASFGVSLLVELVQLFHIWRSFDINDLMANLLGGLIGYGVYRLLAKLLRQRGKRRYRKKR